MSELTGTEILKMVAGTAITYLTQYVLKRILPEENTGGLPWLGWIAAGFFGGALGGFLSGFITFIFGGQPLANWAAFGGGLGLFQWLALRYYRPVGGWFVAASAIGWAVFAVIPAWGWIAAGLSVGLLQFFSLREYGRSFWWIVANGVVWLIASAIAMLFVGPLTAAGPIFGWIIGWGIVGMLGCALLLLPLGLLEE